MEDYREPRAIHDEYGQVKENGSTKGSYIFVMYEGHHRTLEFVYDPSKSLNDNQAKLLKEILEGYLEPVRPIKYCQDVRGFTEGENSKPYNLVLF